MRLIVVAATLVALSTAPASAGPYPRPTAERIMQTCKDYLSPAAMMQEGDLVAKLTPAGVQKYAHGAMLAAMERNNIGPEDVSTVDAFCQFYLQGNRDATDYAISLYKTK